MTYSAIKSLLRRHGWNWYRDDDDGDVCFQRGNAEIWIQQDDDNEPYIYDNGVECYICNIYRLVFTFNRLIIIWNDHDEWSHHY